MGLMNGLSALGAGVAQFAGNAGLELQKSQLAQQQAILADQLATTRETALQASGGAIAATAAAKEQDFRSGLQASQQAFQGTQTDKELAARASEGSLNRGAEMARTQAQINAPPETIKLLKALGVPLPGAGGGAAPTGGTGASSSGSTPDQSTSAPASGGSPAGSPAASADPMANPLVRKALGFPLAGSAEASRMAIAQDVASDPAFKYKTAGQQAAEIENRVAVAEGKMTSKEAQASDAAMIASYQMAPFENYALTKSGSPETMAQVKQLNPDYQASRYPEINKAMSAFGTGKQGDVVRALDVGVQHLDVFDQAAAALKNGDIQKLNSMGNYFAQQFGAAAPTTLDGLKQFVATEILKSVAGGIGSAEDRDRLMKSLDGANSPAQLQAMTNGFRSLMIGQLNGLKTQYEAATDFKSGPFAFEKKLSPDTLKVLSGHSGSAASVPPTAPDPLAMARDAIAQGAPAAAVAKRLRDNGIDPSRLLTTTAPGDLARTPGQD